MKLNIQNTDYWIYWEYHTAFNKDNKLVPKTICKLETSGFTEVTSEYAICSSNDKFIKEIGRKVSLRKLLNKQWPGQENKHIRTLIWNTYLNRKS